MRTGLRLLAMVAAAWVTAVTLACLPVLVLGHRYARWLEAARAHPSGAHHAQAR